MNVWFHSTIAATAVVATAAVAFAGVSLYDAPQPHVLAKSDRLPVSQEVASSDYITVESRGELLSVLERVPVTKVAAK